MPDPDPEMTVTERVAVVVYLLTGLKWELTPEQIGDVTGLSPSGVYRMMATISRKTPIYQRDGVWVMCEVIR